MSWHEDFSEAEYQQYWQWSAEQRYSMIQTEQTPEALKALLLYQQGKHLLNHKGLKSAVTSFDRALEIRPDWHEVWTDRALALLKLGEYEAAVDSSNHAVALNPDDAKAWSYRGTALYGLRQFDEAANSCDRALEVDPNDYHAWRTLSDSLNVQQRYEEAIASYDKALDLKPDDTPAWGQRGTALQKLGRYDEAIVSYDRLLELEPNNYKLWHQRGLALRKLTQFEAAITSFDQALDVRPDFYPATRSKLFVLLTTGQILSYLTNQRSLLERTKLQNDLRNVFDSLVKTKLPALVVLALVAAQTTRSMTALGIAGIFLLIAIISDLIAEARQ